MTTPEPGRRFDAGFEQPQPAHPRTVHQQAAHPRLPLSAAATTAAPYPATVPVTTAATTRSTTAVVLGVVGIVVLGVVLLAVLGYVTLGLGTGAIVVCGLIALVPLTLVLLVVRWIDRWEPEPRLALWFAFLWGAAGSVAIALLVDFGVQILVYVSGAVPDPLDVTGAVLQAPIVEEVAKGLGILAIFLVARRSFDGPVDGVVYAAVIASGFAFVENILYFGSSLLEYGPEDLALTFVLRGVLSPFAHVMFTACTGVAFGLAARMRNGGLATLIVLAGLAGAIALHALWNGASFIASNWLGFYAIVQVPLFLLAAAGVVVLRLTERRMTRARLDEYAAAGWFDPSEVVMLSSGSGRRVARSWARGRGGSTPAALRRFVDASTRLAYARQRRLTGRPDARAAAEERALLDAVTAARAALAAG